MRWLGAMVRALASRQAMSSSRAGKAGPAPASPRPPLLAAGATRFMELEREVEQEYGPWMLQTLQAKVEEEAKLRQGQVPQCVHCGQAMRYHDTRKVSWWARFGKLRAAVARYRCAPCHYECRPFLDHLGVEPGRISGSLARLLVLLAVITPYELAARLAGLLLGVKVSAMGVWRVTQRLGEAAARYTEELSQYHGDSRSEGKSEAQPPAAVVVVGIDGCTLGMQVRTHRRRRPPDGSSLPPLPPVEEGQFREVKTGVLLRPDERVETCPGRHSLVRRFLVTCLGNADAIFSRLWAQLQELGWLGANTVVVVIGDGAEWIWKRAWIFPRCCEILDFWHALEHAWSFARLQLWRRIQTGRALGSSDCGRLASGQGAKGHRSPGAPAAQHRGSQEMFTGADRLLPRQCLPHAVRRVSAFRLRDRQRGGGECS